MILVLYLGMMHTCILSVNSVVCLFIPAESISGMLWTAVL